MLIRLMRGLYVSASTVMEIAASSESNIVIKTRDGQFHSIAVDAGKNVYDEVDTLANQINLARANWA